MSSVIVYFATLFLKLAATSLSSVGASSMRVLEIGSFLLVSRYPVSFGGRIGEPLSSSVSALHAIRPLGPVSRVTEGFSLLNTLVDHHGLLLGSAFLELVEVLLLLVKGLAVRGVASTLSIALVSNNLFPHVLSLLVLRANSLQSSGVILPIQRMQW